MALRTSLPCTALELRGGCFCKANRYTITIPPVQERPILAAGTSVEYSLPVMQLDHCVSCRHAAGTVMQSWIICPPAWIHWDIALRTPPDDEIQNVAADTPVQWISVPASDMVCPSPTVNAQTTYLSHFASSPNVSRTFCNRCGTNLTFYYLTTTSPVPVVDLSMGSLDDESWAVEGVKVDRHAWWGDALQWIRDLVYPTPRSDKGTNLLRFHAGRVLGDDGQPACLKD
ncbi:hypothetical protein FISHEDRAFT_72608 [Fistulina hepatica ATCC 64428]|nr:hypothetical protein FISHEDRAFT_72608 [Fistulina hepatica ATCC 64428]